MTRFLIFYFVAYGGCHIYLHRKISRACNLSRKASSILALPLAFIFIAPLAARKLESAGFEKLAELLAPTGYIWMGLLFLFITASWTTEIASFILRRSRLIPKAISPKALLLIACSYTTVTGIYGWKEAKDIRTEKIVIKTPKIPAEMRKIRLVQISDIHLGQVVREERIISILKRVKDASPDIVISTGDLVDGHQRHLNGMDSLFTGLNPPLGKYAIMGNHEYYVGRIESVNFMRKAGFIPLINESAKIGSFLFLTGADDLNHRNQRNANAAIEAKQLSAAPESSFKILLKHKPVLAKETEGKFDLQLSGHVHKGQIFPFNLLTWTSFPVKTGLTALNSGGYLYVSRGTGVWGPPIRFLAPPEVTVIDLEHSN